MHTTHIHMVKGHGRLLLEVALATPSCRDIRCETTIGRRGLSLASLTSQATDIARSSEKQESLALAVCIRSLCAWSLVAAVAFLRSRPFDGFVLCSDCLFGDYLSLPSTATILQLRTTFIGHGCMIKHWMFPTHCGCAGPHPHAAPACPFQKKKRNK